MTAPEIKALWDRSISLHSQSRYDEAIDCMLRLKPLLPDNPLLQANLGMVYRDSGDLEVAEQYLRQARTLRPGDPSIRFNLALTLLRAGRLKEGFCEYECRWQIPQFQELHRQFSQPLWQGEPLEGRRILIHGEQGAGDSLQFARYAPLVRAAGGEVIIEVLPHLERLMGWMDGGYRIVSAQTKALQFDLHCPLMSLPHRFATESNSIPAPARFFISPALKAKWLERLQTGRKHIGIVWAGNPKHPNDYQRSLPAECFLPLAQLPAVQCWSLQVGPRAAEVPEGVIDLAPELTDFAETSGVVSALDLIVTADTAVAHLAGSLGKPVWLLAAHACDWRWMLDREDSPWYPSMRIFRQKQPGGWSDVLHRVVAAFSSS